MFFHTARLEFESKPDKPDKPDPVYAHSRSSNYALSLRSGVTTVRFLSSSGLGVTG
jgi:hypothetical protein